MSAKPWLSQYPLGIPEFVDYKQYASIDDLFLASVDLYGNKTAVENLEVQLSYRDLNEKAQALAAFFQQELGLKKGDRLAIMLPNCLQYMITMLAAFKAGLVVVNVNPLYSVRELVHQLNDAEPRVIVVLENVANTLADALPQVKLDHVIMASLGDAFPMHKALMVNFVLKYIKKMLPRYHIQSFVRFRKALSIGRHRVSAFSRVSLTQEDIAFLQYTGGTTGLAKAAVLTHGNMLANVEQAYTWIKHLLTGDGEVALTPLPLYHIFSLVASCLVYLRAGLHNVLVTNPRDLPALVALYQKHRVKAMMGVNTLFNALANNTAFMSADHSDLKLVIAGGMALQKSVADKWRSVTGNSIIEGYGLTEASPIISIGLLDGQSYTGSIGLPISSTEVCIMNDEGQVLPVGEVGELCARGPQVMQAYWQKPEETAAVFFEDAWLRTGDMAKMDERGYVYIVDRKKDMITVAGFNVYPNEVESVIASHPDVLEVSVIGVPNRITGESVMAYIVPKNQHLDKAVLSAFCRENMVSYKVPRRFKFVDELPKSNVGKILRRELRKL